MFQLFLIIYIIQKLHYHNKPITGNSVTGKDWNVFKSRKDKGGSRVSLGIVAFSVLAMFVMGIITVHNFMLDGAYAFYDKSVNLNEYIRGGVVPEKGTYVTLEFNMIGDEFFPIAYENPGVYFPVVLKGSMGSTGRPNVVAVYISKKDEASFKSYIEEHKSHFNGSDSNGHAVIKYDGRIIKFTDEMNKRFSAALETSGITEKDYVIRPYVINCRIDQDEIKASLIIDLAICHTLFSLAFILFIDYLIDEGKLD